ncbi:universal stress protein [Ruixingdingia sedimenti]|uniref:Universal stress protein n=1 Tax=Ruixingdingia sedimenti TaxID=3073604 RepID=A0ABU1F5T0_9RHOB|nr:universal stress protein [Xinfangfangia sp. LG-4]MDR5652230.1 universal stress protein [Xinfangfangia sp. LG-4]
MAYKTLLTILTADQDAPAAVRAGALEAAVALARREDAHLDVLTLGVDRTQIGYFYPGASAVIYQQSMEAAQAQAAALEQLSRDRLGREDIRWGVDSAVAQLGGLGPLVAQASRFADLVVLPKPYGEARGPEEEAALEAALFDGQAPVLVVPEGADISAPPRRVVVAWNQSSEALVAIRRALPMLKKATSVNIAIIDPPAHGPERSDPGGMLSQWLARQGVSSEVSVLARTMSRISDILARHVRDQNADMLVMGAYGHSRFREAILGGATRNMLEITEVPVLLAH